MDKNSVDFAECARIEGMKVFVCTNDHTPAHFHIKCKNPSLNCKFSIDDCKKESGYYMDTKYYDKLKTWFDTGFIKGGNKTHRTGKEILQEKWNEFHSEK